MQEHNGVRRKVQTMDDNEIDTMFVDNRSRNNGKTLVICSEGNAGFYEIGIASTPIDLEFSVLGWNHPGFSGSSVSLIFIVICLQTTGSMIKIIYTFTGKAIPGPRPSRR